MNPVEEFYEEKRKYDELDCFLKDKFLFVYEIVEDKKGRNTINISLSDNARKIISKDEANEVTNKMKSHLRGKERDFEDYILEKAREKLEKKRQRVIRDFKLIGSVKGGE